MVAAAHRRWARERLLLQRLLGRRDRAGLALAAQRLAQRLRALALVPQAGLQRPAPGLAALRTDVRGLQVM